MQASSLADIFSRHAGFPRAGAARLGSEDFADRITDRIHTLGDAGVDDAEAWVEHFFDLEHPFEARDKEFKAAASLADRGPSVLEFELGAQEYVVVEDDDDNLVVISNQGTVVLDKRSDLAPRVRAAALPADQQVRPGSVFRPQGEHAYFVERSGRVLSVDSKAVASLLRGVDTRVEPLARVAQASSRLAAFAPTRREASPLLRPEPVRKVAAIAKAEQRGTGPQVVVVEKTRVREIEGASARVWRSLAEKLAARGGADTLRTRGRSSRASGVSGVALSSRTYAVKVGGVTALVQRASPTSLSDKLAASSSRAITASRVDQLVRSRLPTEQRGYWSSPSAPLRATSAMLAPGLTTPVAGIAVAGARGPASPALSGFAGHAGFAPESVLGAVRQARTDARAVLRPDAKTDVLVVAAPGDEAPRGFAVPSQPGPSPSQELPKYSVRGSETVYSGPIEARDALPANTLFTLYGALERTAALSGYRLPSLDVAVEPAPQHRPSVWYRDADVSAVRELSFSAIPMGGGERLRAVLSMPFTQGGLNVGGDLTQALDALVEQRFEAPTRVSARFESAPTVGLPTRAPVGRAAGVTAASVSAARASYPFDGPARDASFVESAPGTTAPASSSAATIGGFTPSAPARVASAAAPFASRAPVSPWVAWAFSNLSEARARTSGDTPGLSAPVVTAAGSSAGVSNAGPAIGSFGALSSLGSSATAPSAPPATGGPSSSAPALGSLVEGASPASEAPRSEGVRRQSVFLRFDPVDAPVRPLNVAEATGGFPVADTGLVRMPVALDDATFDRMVVSSPTISTRAPMGTFAGEWLPAQGVAPAVSMRVKPMLLSDVNAQRLPPTGAGVGGYEGVNSASDEFVVPVPLWVQMASAAPSPSASPEASPYGPETTSYFPGSPAAGSASVGAAYDTRSVPSGGLLSLGADPAVVSGATLPGGSLPRPDGAGFSVTGAPRRGVDVMRGAGASSSLAGLDLDLELPNVAARGAAPRNSALSDLSFDFETVSTPGAPAARTSSIQPVTAPTGATSSRMSVASRTAAPRATPAAPAPSSSLDALDLPLTLATTPAKVRAPRMRRQAGTGYLRFKWPSLARWWNTSDSSAARSAGTRLGEGGVVTGSPADREVVGSSNGVAGSAPGSTTAVARAAPSADFGSALGPVSRAAGIGPVVARSDGGPSGLGLQTAGASASSSGSGVRTITAGAGGGQSSEQTYVTVGRDGETKVSTPATRTAARTSTATSPSVDMTVVAAVQPQAPSLESMTTKAFLKSKKEGGAKPAAGGRTDAAGLQGTIDSLAQRIYHRLQRRLKSDEERFGRY